MRCEECDWFEPLDDGLFGECRFSPPVGRYTEDGKSPSDLTWEFPKVTNDDYCSQWSAMRDDR